jgi:hypothetical protein
MVAQQEELGDLKLYRIPEPVTVAARSQKQVALLQRDGVQVGIVYRRRLGPFETGAAIPAQRLLVTRNRTGEGLGLPLPAGRLMLFSESDGRRILIGQGTMADHAVGEYVEIPLGPAPGVRTQVTVTSSGKTRSEYTLTVGNDRSEPVRFEAEIAPGDWRFASGTRLGRRNGMTLWSVGVPANGRMSLRYSLTRPR